MLVVKQSQSQLIIYQTELILFEKVPCEVDDAQLNLSKLLISAMIDKNFPKQTRCQRWNHMVLAVFTHILSEGLQSQTLVKIKYFQCLQID